MITNGRGQDEVDADAALDPVFAGLREQYLVELSPAIAAKHLEAMFAAASNDVVPADPRAPVVSLPARRRWMVGAAIAGALTLTGGLAAAGELPAPLQQRVSAAASRLGIIVPAGDAPDVEPPAGGGKPIEDPNADQGQKSGDAGQSSDAPGHGGVAPGQSEDAPGHGGTGPGKSEDAPGQDPTGDKPKDDPKAPSEDPGKSEDAPGQTDSTAAPGNGNPGNPPPSNPNPNPNGNGNGNGGPTSKPSVIPTVPTPPTSPAGQGREAKK